MSAHLVEIEVLAKAIHDALFEERWDELPNNSISRALYRQAAEAAIIRLDRLRSVAKPDQAQAGER